MKTNELRIGNLLQGQTRYVTIREIISLNCVRIFESTSSFTYGTCLKPIELTKELLLYFGFTSNDYEDEFTLNQIMLDCEYTDTNTYNLSIDNAKMRIDIKYVHQLQNLFFALYGEELEMKKGNPEELP